MALPRKISEENKSCCLDPQIKRGMNPKKQHEVSHMSALINDITVRTGCDVVIDVGSGLVCITLYIKCECFKTLYKSNTKHNFKSTYILIIIKCSRSFCISQQNFSVPSVCLVCLSLYLINTWKSY